MNFDFDEKQTRMNAKELLNKARRMRSIVESQSYVRSPTMSHSPITHSNTNSEAVARMALKSAEAKEELNVINEAMNLMSEEQGLLLAKKYLDKNKKSDTDLYLNMNLAASSFYKRVDKALVEFAFCYRGGELVVWKN